ncbi:hypothetical protein MMC34_006341 [Xylographa carneopallida]|nr:hypothetical protein [Xylographa carneopallida]
MQDAPLLRRDADADTQVFFEERAAYADAYALPEAAAAIRPNSLSRMNPATLDRTTTKLGRRSAKYISNSASRAGSTSKSGSTRTKKPDRVGQVLNNAGPVLNGVGSIIQGIDGLVRRELIPEDNPVYQRSPKSISSSSAKTHTGSSSHHDRVGQVLNNAGPVLNGVGSIIQGIDGLVRREPILEDNTLPLVYQRSPKFTSSLSAKTHTSSSSHHDHVGQVLNNAGPVLNGVGSIIQGIDGLVRRDLTTQEASMLHARSLQAHRRNAKKTSTGSTGSSGTTKSQSSISKPKPKTRTSGSTSSHPDRVGQVINNAGSVLNGVGSIMQGIDGLRRRDLTEEEFAFLEARNLQAAADRRRSFHHITSNLLQNKVTETPRGRRVKREAGPEQLRSPKYLRRSASVSSYFQPLERDVENVGTVVAREAEAEAEAARDIAIKPDSTTTTSTSASGNQVVNTVSISETAKNGTSAVESEPKKKTTKEKEESERKHPKELKAKEDEKEEAKKGREHRIKEQKHREKLHEQKLAKEKAESKKLGKTIKEMNSTATGIKETSKENATATVGAARKADLNAKPVPSIPAQVAKVAARAAEIVRSWTGLNE